MPNGRRRAPRAKAAPRRRYARDSRALFGIKQGVGGVTAVPFGGYPMPQRRRRRGRNGRNGKMSEQVDCAYLDAFRPHHLSLPRAVGSYTVIRTTQIFKTANKNIVLGPTTNDIENGKDRAWSNCVGFQGIRAGDPIDGTPANSTLYCFDTIKGNSGWNFARVVPAAFSVQVLCPTSLQTATGILAAGRARQVLELDGQAKSWDNLSTDLINYSYPRLLSAGKLVLRGVQIDAVPYNMSALSDFRQVEFGNENGDEVVLNGSGRRFEGFAPIFINNPDNADLELLVCCEWRVRFDPSTPAYATHVRHAVTSDQTWERVIKKMEAMGNGVKDIVETVAAVGNTAAGLAAAGAAIV